VEEVNGGIRPPEHPHQEDVVTQYLLAIQQPQGETPPPADLEAIMTDVEAVRRDMIGAGVWVFSGGLHDAATATVVRSSSDELVVTDGPYAEGKEQIGGLTILDAPDLDAALGWAGRLATAIAPLAIEVRPFQ